MRGTWLIMALNDFSMLPFGEYVNLLKHYLCEHPFILTFAACQEQNN